MKEKAWEKKKHFQLLYFCSWIAVLQTSSRLGLQTTGWLIDVFEQKYQWNCCMGLSWIHFFSWISCSKHFGHLHSHLLPSNQFYAWNIQAVRGFKAIFECSMFAITSRGIVHWTLFVLFLSFNGIIIVGVLLAISILLYLKTSTCRMMFSEYLPLAV